MRSFVHDLRVAMRLLRQSPGLSAAAILTLALGIGANTTIYSFADAVLYRPLDVPGGDRLVHVYERREQPGQFPMSFSEYPMYRARATTLEAVAAHYSTAPLHALIGGVPEALTGAVTTASYFDVLQVRPLVGRFYAADEDRVTDRDAVAVISYGLWQRRLAGDPEVVGRALTLNGRVFTVIGVAPAGFAGVQARGAAIDVWIPSAMFAVGYRYCAVQSPACAIVQLVARLRRGASVENAQRELDAIAKTVESPATRERKRLGVSVVPARGLGAAPESSERRQVEVFLWAVTLVLVITCANLAGLLLARATARRRDIAVRLALGASRRRIISQILAESTVLAFVGGAAGLLAATWSTDMLAALYTYDSAGRALTFDLSLTPAIVAAAFGLTLISALLAGVFPALQASRHDVVAVLKDESVAGGARRAGLRQLLVSAQVAVSVVLLVGASLLIGSMRQAWRGPGFDPDTVITLRLRPSLVAYSRERAHAFQRDVIRRLESLPGVVSASPSVYMSIFSGGPRVSVAPAARPADSVFALANAVGPRYFSTLGTVLVEGREFDDADRAGAPPVAMANDVVARQLSPDRPLTGATLVVDGRPHTVIGVVRDAQYYVAGEEPRGQVFLSYWQTSGDDVFLNDSRTFVRVAGDPGGMMEMVRRAIADVDASVPVSEAHPLSARVGYMFQPVLVARLLLTAFALLALVLSAVGLYGVLAFSVNERTREIGVRFAMGATRRQIAALVLRDAAVVVGLGVAAGLVIAWNSTHVVASLLFGVTARNVVAFLAAPVAVTVVALIASYLPARRAAQVSPLRAMRTE